MHDTPDLNSYYTIHAAMRRGSSQLAAAIAGLAEGDVARAKHVRWYSDGLTRELHVHHTIEDDLFFPALAERVPAFADYDATLADDHVHLTKVVAALTGAVRGLAGGQHWELHHAVAVKQSAELADLLDRHLALEDDDVLPLFERHFTSEEYHQLEQQAVKRTGLRQLLFTVPWAVTTADPDPDAAAHALEQGPAVLRIVWRVTGRRYVRRAAKALGNELMEVAR
jgi:hemerythrin-like domain-containing protein